MTKFLAFSNQKGGSGKTTTAVHVAAGLAILGKKVLLIDCDPQAHATLWLVRDNERDKGLYEVLIDQVSVNESLSNTYVKGLSLLSASRKLSEFEVEYTKKPGAAHILKKRLSSCVSQFDCVVFDTPPYLGLLLVSVLMATRFVFVTLPLQVLAMEGLSELVGLIKKINYKANNGLELKGIIPVMFNKNLVSSRRLLKEIISLYGERLLYPFVRQNVKLSEAPGIRKLIYDYVPDSHGAVDYWNLVNAINLNLLS